MLIDGSDLLAMDEGGTSDPYCKFRYFYFKIQFVFEFGFTFVFVLILIIDEGVKQPCLPEPYFESV